MAVEFEIREQNIDGMKEWVWPVEDSGLWDGPISDWRQHHKQKILKYCKNFRVVVQAGGACGMYPRLLSNMFQTVYTFEPVRSNFYCLVQNCYERNVIMLNAALGETKGLISIKPAAIHNAGTFRTEEKENSFIPRLTIDSIPYQFCDLIMLDTEGAEGDILKGAMETIHKFNPVIFVECGTTRCGNLMKKLGYKVVDEAAQDTIFIREQNI